MPPPVSLLRPAIFRASGTARGSRTVRRHDGSHRSRIAPSGKRRRRRRFGEWPAAPGGCPRQWKPDHTDGRPSPSSRGGTWEASAAPPPRPASGHRKITADGAGRQTAWRARRRPRPGPRDRVRCAARKLTRLSSSSGFRERADSRDTSKRSSGPVQRSLSSRRKATIYALFGATPRPNESRIRTRLGRSSAKAGRDTQSPHSASNMRNMCRDRISAGGTLVGRILVVM